jgi:hypothetical protein
MAGEAGERAKGFFNRRPLKRTGGLRTCSRRQDLRRSGGCAVSRLAFVYVTLIVGALTVYLGYHG